MKTVTIELSDELFDRARRRAAERGASLQEQVVELVKEFSAEGNGQHALSPHETNLNRLFAALDKSRNAKPIGKLVRSELYDRDVLR
jgi:hypothetical protein